mmetsp:Transcript_11178/g.20162  ORF Transcript_11178/g.20162 Transcript_11178/m.20162 type:complete len:234 (-) Transcript_11178:227-928(-)
MGGCPAAGAAADPLQPFPESRQSRTDKGMDVLVRFFHDRLFRWRRCWGEGGGGGGAHRALLGRAKRFDARDDEVGGVGRVEVVRRVEAARETAAPGTSKTHRRGAASLHNLHPLLLRNLSSGVARCISCRGGLRRGGGRQRLHLRHLGEQTDGGVGGVWGQAWSDAPGRAAAAVGHRGAGLRQHLPLRQQLAGAALAGAALQTLQRLRGAEVGVRPDGVPTGVALVIRGIFCW